MRARIPTRMNSVPTAPEMPAIATLGPSGVLAARVVTEPQQGRRVASVARRVRLARDLGAAYAPRAPERKFEVIEMCMLSIAMIGRRGGSGRWWLSCGGEVLPEPPEPGHFFRGFLTLVFVQVV